MATKISSFAFVLVNPFMFYNHSCSCGRWFYLVAHPAKYTQLKSKIKPTNSKPQHPNPFWTIQSAVPHVCLVYYSRLPSARYTLSIFWMDKWMILLSSRSPSMPAQVLFLLWLWHWVQHWVQLISQIHTSVSITLNPENFSSSHNRITTAAEFIPHTVARITFIMPPFIS